MNHKTESVEIGIFQTPVAFFVYNRPVQTERVFSAIREIRPATLLIIADGPLDNPDDAEKCHTVRSLILENIDWDCRLHTNLSTTNLGCGRRISSGIDWIFSIVEEAIIIEDDCLPDSSFFQFCSHLLDMYRGNESIGQICGFRYVGESTGIKSESYEFSMYSHIWGWATWRRAWVCYDYRCSNRGMYRLYEDFRNAGLSRKESLWRSISLSRVNIGQIDTWDYQWDHAKFTNGFLNIIPASNLVANIGIGIDSTHTAGTRTFPDVQPVKIPMVHPCSIKLRASLEKAIQTTFLPSFPRIIWQGLKYCRGRILRSLTA